MEKSERSGTLDSRIDLGKAKIFAEKLAVLAGRLLLDYSDEIKILKHKDRQDIAVNADYESEKLIIQAIEKDYPTHSILSEERGQIKKKSDYTWLVDPLDGTKEYVRGLPFYNVALSLQQNGKERVAVIFRPTDRQLFSALKGGGAFLNGKRIKVSSATNLLDSFVYSYLPLFKGKENDFETAWTKLISLSKRVYRLRGASDLNFSCCWVAKGACEGLIDLTDPPKPWDIRPGLFIAQEAGGKISDISGGSLSDNFKNGIIVSNGKIHKTLLEVLND